MKLVALILVVALVFSTFSLAEAKRKKNNKAGAGNSGRGFANNNKPADSGDEPAAKDPIMAELEEVRKEFEKKQAEHGAKIEEPKRPKANPKKHTYKVTMSCDIITRSGGGRMEVDWSFKGKAFLSRPGKGDLNDYKTRPIIFAASFRKPKPGSEDEKHWPVQHHRSFSATFKIEENIASFAQGYKAAMVATTRSKNPIRAMVARNYMDEITFIFAVSRDNYKIVDLDVKQMIEKNVFVHTNEMSNDVKSLMCRIPVKGLDALSAASKN